MLVPTELARKGVKPSYWADGELSLMVTNLAAANLAVANQIATVESLHSVFVPLAEPGLEIGC